MKKGDMLRAGREHRDPSHIERSSAVAVDRYRAEVLESKLRHEVGQVDSFLGAVAQSLEF